MPRATSFTLGDHFEGFIQDEVQTGRYASASEVVREGLRLLEERKQHMHALRAALIAGEQSGPARPLTAATMDEIKARARARASGRS